MVEMMASMVMSSKLDKHSNFQNTVVALCRQAGAQPQLDGADQRADRQPGGDCAGLWLCSGADCPQVQQPMVSK